MLLKLLLLLLLEHNQTDLRGLILTETLMLSLEAAPSAAASLGGLLLLVASRRSGVWALITAPDLYLILVVYMQQSSIFRASRYFYCLFV